MSEFRDLEGPPGTDTREVPVDDLSKSCRRIIKVPVTESGDLQGPPGTQTRKDPKRDLKDPAITPVRGKERERERRFRPPVLNSNLQVYLETRIFLADVGRLWEVPRRGRCLRQL